VSDWPGHVAGQRVDLRVTAADGYSAVREYSIASAPRADGYIELSIERLLDGEVSPYRSRSGSRTFLNATARCARYTGCFRYAALGTG
jgi:ferredoxin-NADP reductase